MIRKVLDVLTNGEFVCQQTHPKVYCMLQDEDLRTQVVSALKPFGRTLKSTKGYESYFCAYEDISHADDARKVRSQFEQMRDVISPVTAFVTAIMRADGRDVAIFPGDILKFSNILVQISNEPAFQTDLKRIGSYRLFATAKREPDIKDRLQAMFDGMAKEGFIKLSNAETKIYTVTGKMAHYHECIAYICEHEDIEPDEESKDQEELRL